MGRGRARETRKKTIFGTRVDRIRTDREIYLPFSHSLVQMHDKLQGNQVISLKSIYQEKTLNGIALKTV